MSKTLTAIILVAMTGVLLSGCMETNDFQSENVSPRKEPDSQTLTTQRYKMNTGDRDIFDSYVFNGFIGEDTLSFQELNGNKEISVYQPAKIGHTFRFKYLKNLEFEVIDFSREQGYVEFEITSIKQ